MKPMKHKNSMSHRLSMTVILLSFLVLCSCEQENLPVEDGDISVETTSTPLYLTGTRWPNNLTGKGSSIPVCYLTPGAVAGSVDEADREAFVTEVRGYIAQTWGRVANLNFTGWGRCSSANPGGTIRINVTTSDGNKCSIGYQGSSNSVNMVLNMNESRQPVSSVHEFGHSLGFHHEFTRTLWDSNWGASVACTTNAQCTNVNYGRTCVGGFCREPGGQGLHDENTADFHSVMAATYVNNDTNGNTNGVANPTVSLSRLDVVGVQEVYGRKPLGAIVGDGNKCIDIHNPSISEPSDSTKLQGWDCLDNANQDWEWEGSNHSGGDILRTSFVRGVMDVKWGNSDNGIELWNWTENTSSAQRWRFEDIALVGIGNLCVDVQWGNIVANQPVWLWSCTNNYAQHWTLDKDQSTGLTVIRQTGGSDSFCLTSQGGSGWQPVNLQPCDGRGAQNWEFLDGQIISSDGRCLDVHYGIPAAQTMLGTYPCWNDDNARVAQAQKFHVSGPIRGLADKCVDFHKPSSSTPILDGQKVQLWSCNGGVNQVWDFYF